MNQRKVIFNNIILWIVLLFVNHWNSPRRLDWPAGPREPPALQCWDYKDMLLWLAVFMWILGSDSRAPACKASTLPTEPASQPGLQFLLFKFIME